MENNTRRNFFGKIAAMAAFIAGSPKTVRPTDCSGWSARARHPAP